MAHKVTLQQCVTLLEKAVSLGVLRKGNKEGSVLVLCNGSEAWHEIALTKAAELLRQDTAGARGVKTPYQFVLDAVLRKEASIEEKEALA